MILMLWESWLVVQHAPLQALIRKGQLCRNTPLALFGTRATMILGNVCMRLLLLVIENWSSEEMKEGGVLESQLHPVKIGY
jgi:hypothetical protein